MKNENRTNKHKYKKKCKEKTKLKRKLNLNIFLFVFAIICPHFSMPIGLNIREKTKEVPTYKNRMPITYVKWNPIFTFVTDCE